MSAFVIFDGEIVNLAHPTTAQYDALWRLHDTQRSRPGNRMPLICTRPHGGPMYLRKFNNRLWAVH